MSIYNLKKAKNGIGIQSRWPVCCSYHTLHMGQIHLNKMKVHFKGILHFFIEDFYLVKIEKKMMSCPFAISSLDF